MSRETATTDWDDLRGRLVRAADELDKLSTDADEADFVRLRAKRSGVLLALDYMQGYRHPQPDENGSSEP